MLPLLHRGCLSVSALYFGCRRGNGLAVVVERDASIDERLPLGGSLAYEAARGWKADT
jgi:hypothetical protein